MKTVVLFISFLIIATLVLGCSQQKVDTQEMKTTEQESSWQEPTEDSAVQGEIEKTFVDDKDLDVGTPY